MPIWCIYEHPGDFPDSYVARLWLSTRPTAKLIIAATLDGVRSQLPKGLTPFPRYPGDDPCIVETWI